jgi:hypothetical protein
MTSIYLNPETWSPVVDSSGNIALASEPYSLAQDAASAIKLWSGELYYDTTQGVSWNNILAKLPPLNYVRSQFVAAALTVPGVSKAAVFFSGFSQRAISGQVQVTDGAGQTTVAAF